MDQNNNYSFLTEKNSLSKITKSSSYQNEKPKIRTLIPESLKLPIQLIEHNNFEKFNSYINSSDVPKSNLNSLLCFCLQNYLNKKNFLDQIKLLIYKGANIDTIYRNIYELSPNISPKVEDNHDITLLMYACLYNDFKLVEIFISKKSINAVDKNGKNALFYLLSKPNNNNQKLDVETAKIIKLLINNDININCEAKYELGNKIIKQSPLSLAANNNYFISFKELLNNGANLNFITEPEGDTILHIAVKKINHEMIKLILKMNNINLEIKNKEGKSARDLALEIEPDSIIYNLIVEKISESDNMERKKSDDLSFEEKSKKSSEQNDNGMNYLSENNIKNDNGKDYTQIKSMLKKYNDKKKNIINKYIKQMKNNSNNIKLYVNTSKEHQNTNNKIDNIDKVVDYIVLENDENKRPIVNIDLLSRKFIDYKKTFVNSNIANINQKSNKKNYINKITFMNNNIDNNINININNDLTKKNITTKLEEENSSLKRDLETVNTKKNELMNNMQERNNYINQLETKHNKEINGLNSKLKKIQEERDIFEEKVKILEKEKNELEEKIIKLEKEKFDLNQNISQIKKEYSELNQKTEKMIKEKENEKLSKNLPIQTIKSNITTYSNYLNKKFVNFNYEKEYMLDCLSADLTDFEIFVKLRIEKEKDIYDTLIKNIQNSVDKSIPNYVVNLYGSHATNLCLPWSDLDVVLIQSKKILENGGNIDMDYQDDNSILLSKLYEYISKEPWVKDCKLISKASVPIIKILAIEKYNNMSIDISIQDGKHFGLKCVELVKKLLDEYKSLKPMTLAIKNILKRANLNDPYKGGISSYGIILMIVFFLQKQKLSGEDISPGENNCNLGKLFFDFLKYYAIFFESNKIIINTNDGMNDKIFNEYELYSMGHSSELIIIDPLNKFNNVAKSCLQYHNIKMSFIISLMTLQDDCECGCHYNQLGENYDNLQLEHCLLKRIFNCVKRFG
jgi:non-canonical poly(A) RNA polymerase PAPD5/7